MMKNTILVSLLVFLLAGVVVSFEPPMPSAVTCEGDCSILNKDGSSCENCFVQVIYTEDNKTERPNSLGGVSGDDVLLDYTHTGSGDFGAGKFNVAVNLMSGDNVYVRAWDSESVSKASHYDDSKIFSVNKDNEGVSLNKLKLSNKVLKDYKENGDLDGPRDVSKRFEEKEEKNVYNASNVKNSGFKENTFWSTGNIVFLLIVLVLIGVLLFFYYKKKRR